MTSPFRTSEPLDGFHFRWTEGSRSVNASNNPFTCRKRWQPLAISLSMFKSTEYVQLPRSTSRSWSICLTVPVFEKFLTSLVGPQIQYKRPSSNVGDLRSFETISHILLTCPSHCLCCKMLKSHLTVADLNTPRVRMSVPEGWHLCAVPEASFHHQMLSSAGSVYTAHPGGSRHFEIASAASK